MHPVAFTLTVWGGRRGGDWDTFDATRVGRGAMNGKAARQRMAPLGLARRASFST